MDQPQTEANSKQKADGNTGGTVIKEVMTNFRAVFESADMGSGPEKKGKGDGMLDRVEMAEACMQIQGERKLSPNQVQALASLAPDQKVKIDDIIRPFEEAMRKCDRDGNGVVTATELAVTKSVRSRAAQDQPAK
jgi:hypothetical protein